MIPQNILTTESTETTEKVTEKDNTVEAYVIGQIQLEGAIEHYNRSNFICAITLARAAEEYLGKLLKYSSNQEPAMEMLRRNILKETEIKEINLNFIANNLKHFDKNFCDNEFNIKLDSIQLICRACTNFISLGQEPTALIKDFYDYHTPAHIDKIINSMTTSAPSAVKKTDDELNVISGKIINCAINVHKQLGPGLLESAYQHGLAYTLAKEGLKFEKEKSIPIIIDDHKLEAGYRADFIVENNIILEIKAIDSLSKNHDAQILNYMRLGKFKLGLLMNFNETLLKNGLKRFKI